MPATSRLALPYPAPSEPPDGPAQIQALAQALDNAAIDLTEGTLAARPAPAIRGRWYYANDVAILYRDSGSTWRSLQQMLGTDVVTATNIAPDAVGTSELAPLAVTNAEVAAAAAIAESKLALASDAAVGTASRRTLGPGALQAAPGNDARFTDQRVPTDGSVTVAKTGTGDNGLAKGAFHAYRSAALVLSGSVDVIEFDTEVFDVSGWFNTANGRYTPLVAGYYAFAARLATSDGRNTQGNHLRIDLARNGSVIANGPRDVADASGGFNANQMSCAGSWPAVFCDGIDDFIEIVQSAGVANMNASVGQVHTWFMGHMVGRS